MKKVFLLLFGILCSCINEKLDAPFEISSYIEIELENYEE